MSYPNSSPLSSHLGEEMLDIDVRQLGTSLEVQPIRDLLHRRQVLCFRNQSLGPEDLLSFTRLFGTPDPHVLQQFTLAGYKEIFVLSNIVVDGRPLGSVEDGFSWHTDLAYLAKPAAYTILYALEVPPEGADTHFASLYEAYDALSEADRERLRPLKSELSYGQLYARRTNPPPLTEEQKARTPDVIHPVVRIHPHTGREGMYLSIDDCKEVLGGTATEGKEFLRQLLSFAVENFSYSHKWKVKDLLIWDNRGALHTASPYDSEKFRRLVYRVTVQGEPPIGWHPTV